MSGPAEGSTPSEAPEPEGVGGQTPSAEPAESDWETKRRLAEIFGDVLPSTTRDERDEKKPGDSGSEDWLRRQVPPHHGGH